MFARRIMPTLLVVVVALTTSLGVYAQDESGPIILRGEATPGAQQVLEPTPIEFEGGLQAGGVVSEEALAAAIAKVPPPWWNIVKNSSAEDGSQTPDYWSTYSWANKAQFSWQRNLSVTGTRSLKIVQTVPDDGRWQQIVPVLPNTDYVLSGWVKTLDVAHTAETIDAGANLSVDSYVPGTGWYTQTPPLIGSNDWTFVSVVFNSGDNSYLTISARLGMYWGTTTGTAWYDEIQLAPLKKIHISSSQNGTVGGVPFSRSDILVHDPVRDTWAMYFDGSDVGIVRNVDCLEVLATNSIIISLGEAQQVPGLGWVRPQDLILFTPTATGPDTAGTFSMHMKGNLNGLESKNENIDACSYNGYDVISTSGPTNIVYKGNDDDLFALNGTSWSTLLSGKNVPNLVNEDVWGQSWGLSDSSIQYLSTQGTYYPGDGRAITNREIFAVDGNKVLRPLFWSGQQHGFRYVIDGFSIER